MLATARRPSRYNTDNMDCALCNFVSQRRRVVVSTTRQTKAGKELVGQGLGLVWKERRQGAESGSGSNGGGGPDTRIEFRRLRCIHGRPLAVALWGRDHSGSVVWVRCASSLTHYIHFGFAHPRSRPRCPHIHSPSPVLGADLHAIHNLTLTTTAA